MTQGDLETLKWMSGLRGDKTKEMKKTNGISITIPGVQVPGGNQIENGKMMFFYQAFLAFEIWTGLLPSENKKTLQLLEND